MRHERWFDLHKTRQYKDQVIIPGEVASALKAPVYSEADKRALDRDDVFPTLDELVPLIKQGFVLLPMPMRRMSVRDISLLLPGLLRDRDAYDCTDTTEPGWLVIEKAPANRSFGQPWSKQAALLGEGEGVPNIAELAWFLAMFSRIAGIYLLGGVRVRTSSLARGGRRILAGYYQESGLQTSLSLFDEFASNSTGILRCRRFPLKTVH